jgi:hypothetical protein
VDEELTDPVADAQDTIRRVRALGTIKNDHFEAFAAESLAKLNDEEIHKMTVDVASCNFARLHPQFIRSCVTVQIAAELQRRLNATESRLRNVIDPPPAPESPTTDAG